MTRRRRRGRPSLASRRGGRPRACGGVAGPGRGSAASRRTGRRFRRPAGTPRRGSAGRCKGWRIPLETRTLSSTGRCHLEPRPPDWHCPTAVSVAQAAGIVTIPPGPSARSSAYREGNPDGRHGIVWPGRAERSGHGAQWPGARYAQVSCLQGTTVNTAILLRFPSIFGRNHRRPGRFLSDLGGNVHRVRARATPRCVSCEKKPVCAGPPCDLARVSLRDTLVWSGRPVCAGSPSSSVLQTWPMRRAGSVSALGLRPPVFADVLPVYERHEPTAGHRRPLRERRGDLGLGCRRPHPIDHPAAGGPK